MPVKLFVGNIGSNAPEYELRKMFERFGAVVECSVINRYAFVHMAHEEDAVRAISTLNGVMFNDHTINIERSYPGKKHGRNFSTTKIFIGNVREGTENDDLRILFETFGEVAEADVCGNYGFVHMYDQDVALKAISQLDGYMLNGNRLSVELSTKRTQGRKQNTRGKKRRMGDIRDDYSDRYYDECEDDYYEERRPNYYPSPPRLPPPPPPPPFQNRPLSFPHSSHLSPSYQPFPSFPNKPPMNPLMVSYPLPLNLPPKTTTIQNYSDFNFSRDLILLYLKDPPLFHKYVNDPEVQKSFNIFPPIEQPSLMQNRISVPNPNSYIS